MEAAGLSSNKSSEADGFTLVELLLVMLIMAVGTALAVLAMRDPVQAQLQGEANRLAGLLEGARAASRTQDAALRWRVEDAGFRFLGEAGNPAGGNWPKHWLHEDMQARVAVGDELILGPEPVLAAQAVQLSHPRAPGQVVWVGSDGVRPFGVLPDRPDWLN